MSEKTKVNKILTPAFRVSFPNVFKAKAAYKDSPPTFNIQMLFPKNHETHKYPENVKKFAGSIDKLKKLAISVRKEKFGDKKVKDWNPLKDGDEKEYDNYHGMTFANAKSKMKPGIVNRKNEDIIDPEEFYAGCWARATITAYSYDVNGNRGVAFGLQNLQFLGDDKSFSGKKNAKDDFEMIDDDFNDDDENDFDDDDDL